jgi:hypothetical protein
MSSSEIENINDQLTKVRAAINELFVIGNSLFSTNNGGGANYVKDQNTILEAKKNKLLDISKRQQSDINRYNRDFIDTKPETIENKRFHVLEDYTLVFLCISYLFMLLVGLHTYVFHSDEPFTTALFKGLLYAFILTMLSGMMLYYIS